MWRRARDKRVPAWWRLRLRFQANRFRTLARGATESNATDEPTDEFIGHIAGQLLIGSEEAWKIVVGNGRTQGATKGGANSQKVSTFDEETWAEAKPAFIEAVEEFRATAKDIDEFSKRLVKHFRDEGMSTAALEEMTPYLARFLKEVRDGTLKIKTH